MAGEVKDTKSSFVNFCKQLNKNPNGLDVWFNCKNWKSYKVVISQLIRFQRLRKKDMKKENFQYW